MISVSNLWFSYDGPRRPVLEDLSLEIPANSVTAILGPNGAGKTTLLHLMLGFLSPARGIIRLAGQPQAGYSRREMGRLMALVPQSEHISFNFSALEYVLLGRTPYLQLMEAPRPSDRQVALEALQTVGADFLQGRSITAMSGGERQLVALARALAQQPRILLLDEPTSHLDLGNQRRILRIMRCLSTAGVTVVFTTHDPNVAAGVASYVVLMRQGRVLVAAPTEAALTSDYLSQTYGVPVEVLTVQGRRMICLMD